MQCTRFTPVHYHARDLDVGASGYSWHLYDSDASYGDGGGYIISVPLCNQYSVYDKEVLKQIIQNHEATFRYQVQELHRLYRRQRDLMDETRMREIFAHHLLSRTSESFHSLSHIGAEFSQNRSATNWLFGNVASTKLSELTSVNVQGHKSVVAEKLDKSTTLHTDSFIRKNSINDVQFLSPSRKQTGTETAALNLKQFELGNLSEAPELTRCTMAGISSFQPASGSDFAWIKTWDFSSSNSDVRKTNCFIDLNEPMQLESLPANSSGPLEAFTGHNKTVCSDKCIPVGAIPESLVPTESQLLKSDDSRTDGVNSSMVIDLNSVPVNCCYETDMILESPRSMSKDSSAYNHATRIRKRFEELKKSDNFLETERNIDLNTGSVDEHSLPPSRSTLQIKSAEGTQLKGPVSPENEESSPPRGNSEDIQLETPHSSEQGEGEPFVEVDTIAAETLVNMVAAVFGPQRNFRNLYWFAEFVSSTGDDLESEVMELEIDQYEENDLLSSHLNKSKGTGTVSRGSGKGQKRGKKRRKNFQTEEALGSRGHLKTSQLKRKVAKNGCAKPRKYSKLSPFTKKSMSSILKQSTARMYQDVLQSWGKIRKRQGGRRRRACNSFSLANLASY